MIFEVSSDVVFLSTQTRLWSIISVVAMLHFKDEEKQTQIFYNSAKEKPSI